MAAATPLSEKKYFTVEQANAMLPLVRAIVKDIAELAISLRDRHERLNRRSTEGAGDGHDEERASAQEAFERDRARMQEYEQELERLGVELKDYFTGLIDFPALIDDREVYLCWRLGEADVGHWHELQAGFAGRKRLMIEQSS